jgi:hypothetical protein
MPLQPRPVRARANHPVAFTAPFYASDADHGLCLHRYLDTEFIPRFLTDLTRGRLADPRSEPWWGTDRFSPHGDELILRLPVHRTFYLVACELVCDQPSQPALDPARIRSAGFVIRRRVGSAPAPAPATALAQNGGGQRRAGLLATLRARLKPAASRCPGAEGSADQAVAQKGLQQGGVSLSVTTDRLVSDARGTADLAAVEAGSQALAELRPQAVDARWMIEDGEPLGWQRAPVSADAPATEPDPDPSRRVAARRAERRALANRGAANRGAVERGRAGVDRNATGNATGKARRAAPVGMTPAYTGEETHPLHPVLVTDAEGRLHTILYGFLPLGGQSLAPGNPFDPTEEDTALAAERDRLTWPFGHRGRANLHWQTGDGALVADGQPSRACFEWLELLVNRYHLGESGRVGPDPLNDDLAAAAERLQFTRPDAPTTADRTVGEGTGMTTGRSTERTAERTAGLAVGLTAGRNADSTKGVFGQSQSLQVSLRRFTLLAYLTDCFAAGADNPLAEWLAARRQAIDAAGGTPTAALLGRLPNRPTDGVGDLAGLSLAITCADAEEWRLLLGQRLLDQARRTGAELPVPKFRQTPDDLYQVIPFVRAIDDAGCERLTWAAPTVRSAPFRVAAPFDPDASRPALIQMPGLGDLKRGLAKGAAMLVPPDTARMLDALNLNEGVGPDLAGEPPAEGGLDVQMICSFSLPIITLVAMILLMIMVMILNIIFFWLPWVKICLPFPKMK